MAEQESKGGCSVHGPFEVSGHTNETCPDKIESSGVEATETGEELVPQDIEITIDDYLGGEAKATIDSSGKIRFTEDVEIESPTMMDESSFQTLIDSGILDESKKSGFGEEGKSLYNLAEDGYDGWINIAKADLNKALDEGRLELVMNNDGAYELSIPNPEELDDDSV